jgi:NADH:ubiquinone oxidoreductase subunit 4 (subunit M)
VDLATRCVSIALIAVIIFMGVAPRQLLDVAETAVRNIF